MNEISGPSQDNQKTPFDHNLERTSAEAAHRLVHDELEGVISHPVTTEHLDPRNPIRTDLERELIRSRAEGVVIAEERQKKDAEKIEELEQQARLDTLTGLRNYSVLEDDLPRALALARREGSGVGLIMLDGKGLKRVNDDISRKAGDELIKLIASVCESNIRKSDGVYRGGKESDEFFILMPFIKEQEEDVDVLIAEKTTDIKEAIMAKANQSQDLKTAVDKGWIGVYFGGAYVDFFEDETRQKNVHAVAEDLLHDADAALRFDKRRTKAEAKLRSKREGIEPAEDDRLQ